ncbi:hypothetical protein ACIGW0_29145 [Streptomyces bikiniensis]|uniref:Uncharacterized protein n=1 Tax=Streptomyces bikiniensis TaxID=1896 RepID=A0ABW8D4C0_STRBI
MDATAAPAAQAVPAEGAGKHRPAPCTGEFRGDARLGPQHLPNERQKPAGPLLDGHHRTGKPSPAAAFLKKYREGPPDPDPPDRPLGVPRRHAPRSGSEGAWPRPPYFTS